MTCLVPLIFRRKRIRNNQIVQSDGDASHVKNYSYCQLKRATQDFNCSNKIGQGCFGSVYKGKLKDGPTVAVKVLSFDCGSKESFMNELSAISNIEHENLVKLYGCCTDGNKGILVYEYAENRSLFHALLGTRRSRILFNWKTRVKICIGIARGLAFLHEGLQTPIVHRDIKASNILLDKDLNPKISDFGLAKLFPPNLTHISTRVAGTLGYLAPEYALRGKLTKKADIYSFGVLLLEVVSGKCNTYSDSPYEDDQFLLEKTWEQYEHGDIASMVDAALCGDFDACEARRFLTVGLLCTQDKTRARPTMSEVVRMLSGESSVAGVISRPGLIADIRDVMIRTRSVVDHAAPLTGGAQRGLTEDLQKTEGNAE